MLRIHITFLKDGFIIAIGSLGKNKLRTFLSLSGIIIGIYTIISVLAAVDSLHSDISRSINMLGGNILFVGKWPWSEMGNDYPWWKYLMRPSPSIEDFQAIKNRAWGVNHAVFSAESIGKLYFEEQELKDVSIKGVTSEYGYVWEVALEKGRFLSEADQKRGNSVVVLGHMVASRLFEAKNPLDKIIKINGRPARVVGVLRKEGRSLMGGFLDESVYMPLNFFRTCYDLKSSSLSTEIAVKIHDNISLKQAREELTRVLRAERRLKPAQEENFSINEPEMLTLQTQNIFRILNIVAFVIGGFSIFIGGFGVANIMFVSVKERTQEIGIQKALGASPTFILWQFLCESVTLALFGCLLGLALVWLSVRAFSPILDFPMELSLGNILLGFLISGVTGLVAGFIPARSASRLHPAVAIRSK